MKNKAHFNPLWFGLYFLVAGIANIIRAGDGIVALILLLPLILSKFGLNYKQYVSTLKKNFRFVIILIIIYLLPFLILNSVRAQRDVAYFNGYHSLSPTNHNIWHHMFIGLGYLPNQYGIKWDDDNPFEFIAKRDPPYIRHSHEYNKAVRTAYYKYAFEHPELLVSVYLAKIIALHQTFGWWVSRIAPNNDLINSIKYYIFYAAFILMFIFSKRDKTSMIIFWTIMISIAATSLPGIIALPITFYLRGLQGSFFVMLFYLSILFYQNIRSLYKKHE